MAWYAELKRRRWFCIVGIYANISYSNKLYDDWYNSLTDEQKERLERKKKEREERRERELEQSFMNLLTIAATVGGLNRRNSKYHGVYDSNGYPDPEFFKNKES